MRKGKKKKKREQEGEEEGKEKKIQRNTKPRPLAPVDMFFHILASIPQLILKEISLEYSLEGLMLKLKLQYFGHLI